MKNVYQILLLICLAIFATSCKKSIEGSGVYINEKRFLTSEFNRIECEGDFEVSIIKDSSPYVVLHGETNILPEVITYVSGSTLRLSYGNYHTHYHHGKLKIYVHLPSLSGIGLYGTGTIISEDTFNNPLQITNTNSGTIELNGTSPDIITVINGPGKINLHGVSGIAKHTVSGSGSLNAFDFKSTRAVVDISGSGNCNVFVTEQLSGTISGSGSVYYLGNPVLQVNITGSGDITKQ